MAQESNSILRPSEYQRIVLRTYYKVQIYLFMGDAPRRVKWGIKDLGNSLLCAKLTIIST